MNACVLRLTLALCGGLCAAWPAVCHAQMLETETARLLRRGTWEFNTAVEVQSSGEGTERAVPVALEYGVRDRFYLLAEPVVYTAIRPHTGAGATGAGDLELTGIVLLRAEAGAFPALAVAGEVKIPTARNEFIGTGKTDYAGYLIASKRVGALDLHCNVGYAILGQPEGTNLNNIVTGALAAEYRVSRRVLLFGEVLANTSASPEGGPENTSPTNPATAEVTGGELVGTLGFAAYLGAPLLFSLGVSVDNNQAVLVRPGITYRP